MKVYSPSSTSTWTRCPMMRALSREWQPKYLAKKDWSAMLGQGFAAGIGIYNNLRQEWERAGAQAPERDASARAVILQACQDAAVKIMMQKADDLQAAGFVTAGGNDQEYQDKLVGRLNKALSSYIVSDPLPDSWRVVDAEKDFGEAFGDARADLIVHDQNGNLVVIDYKTKLTLKAEYRQKTLQDYANSHQMLHYSWAARETYGEPVYLYQIGLAVFEPRWAFDFIPFPISPEGLLLWLSSSQRIWDDMAAEEAGDRLPWMSANHSDNFGLCPYYKACFTHRLDENLMAEDYVNITKS